MTDLTPLERSGVCRRPVMGVAHENAEDRVQGFFGNEFFQCDYWARILFSSPMRASIS